MDNDSSVVPSQLQMGVPMLKISSKKIKQVIFKIRNGCILWSSKKDSRVPIGDIRDLRLGQPPTDSYNSTRWITVVYVRSQQWKVLHMIALTDEIYFLWIKTLKQLVSITLDRQVTDITPSDPDMLWIRQLWPLGTKAINREKAEALCAQIGLQIRADVGHLEEGMLDITAFHDLIKASQTRPDINQVYRDLTNNGPLDEGRAVAFLTHVQRIPPSSADDVFNKYKSGDLWTIDSLTSFLSSSDNTPDQPQDMTHPLQHYFISSSHNTYLVGEQWKGESTVEGYIRVLLAGCRCVEMDVQSGDVEPVVYHRKTLTSSVPVRDICRAIKQYGFVTSPYPIIISTEIHCTSEQQNRLAIILKEVFGHMLVSTPLVEEFSELPSPEDLKGKILFKAKPPKPEANSPKFETNFFYQESPSSTDSDASFVRLARRLSIQSKIERPDTFSPQLSELLVYTHGVKYQGFSKLNEYLPSHQFSVSERTAAKILKENKGDWIKHNFKHISRVYPRGTRLGSTNFNPVDAWSAGCQIVALNWQTLDESILLNHAMFHGSNGYVLKPLALREKVIEMPEKYLLTVRIISGQRTPLCADLYVEAILNGKISKRTRALSQVTLNPLWDETLTFEIISAPSLLMLNFLHLEVRNKALQAQWMRPVGLAPRGYHHLPLYDSLLSRFVFATLFVEITLEKLQDGVVDVRNHV
ncbi:phosphatidylinositol phospholipase C, delta [Cryptococcus neoformans]|nr:phosphatidylinositol phospholipase C, delta [Cryptococcus neoformans var. grubii]OXC62924.1 phosphatidylinositol phospholipase C, delta [Cryptococcus neoformans var. grubii MW-RSA852]